MELDAHMHLWDLDEADSPHLESRLGSDVPRRHLEVEYNGNWGATHRYVHVEALLSSGAAEVEWLLAGHDSARLAGIVAYCDLSHQEALPTVRRLKRLSPKVVGIRHILNFDANDSRRTWPAVEQAYEQNEQWQRTFGALRAESLTFDVQCNVHQLTQVARVGGEGSVKMVLDHLGPPLLESTCQEEQWLTALNTFSRVPDAHVKCSMLPHLFMDHRAWWSEERSSSKAWHLIDQVLKMFASRTMLASNAPVDSTFECHPSDVKSFHQTLLQGRDAESAASLRRGAAERFYGV